MPERAAAGSLDDPIRLQAVAATGLTDAAPDEALEHLTKLVQRCLNVPVALVSLVEAHRQVFASHQGLAEPWCSRGETPLSHSFCQHVVVREEPLVVEDAREDARLRDNLAIRDLGVVAYLGVPLRTPDGHTVGSLCAIDGAPRAWTPADVESMEALADATMVTLAMRYRATESAAQLGGALGRSEALCRALLDAAPPTLVLRPTGAVATANPAALALADLPARAVLGLRVWSVLPVYGEAEDELRDAVTCAASGVAAELRIPVGEAPTTLRVRPVPEGDGLLLLQAV